MTASSDAIATAEVIPAEPYEGSEGAGEEDDEVEMPCIQLSDFDEEMGVPDQSDDATTERAAMAVAETICTSVRDVEVEGGYSTRKIDFSDRRAEFVSVCFWKDHPGIPLGINLLRDQARIASLTENSVAYDSPLRANDKFLSVNNKDCSLMTSSDVADLLCESFGCVNVVIHNEGGAPDLVESMVVKSQKDEKLGVTLKKLGSGSLVVSSVEPGSKLSNSLLNPGDLVLSINDSPCAHLGLSAAFDLIKHNPQKVTFLAKTLRETGVVVAQISGRNVASSNVPVLTASQARATNANAATTRPVNRRPNTGRTEEQKKVAQQQTVLALFCFCVVVIVAVAVAVPVSQQEDGDDYYSNYNNYNDGY